MGFIGGIIKAKLFKELLDYVMRVITTRFNVTRKTPTQIR